MRDQQAIEPEQNLSTSSTAVTLTVRARRGRPVALARVRQDKSEDATRTWVDQLRDVPVSSKGKKPQSRTETTDEREIYENQEQEKANSCGNSGHRPRCGSCRVRRP